VVREIVTKGAFYWLRTPKSSVDLRNDEWVLAAIRFLLAACALIYLVYPASASGAKSHVFILLAYICYSCLVAAALICLPVLPQSFQIYLHCLDLVWAAVLTGLVSWPAIEFAALFYVIAIAVLRWGFWEAILTLIAYSALVFIKFQGHEMATPLLWAPMGGIKLSPGLFPEIGMILMIGLLAETRSMRSVTLAMARIHKGFRMKSGLNQAMRDIGSEALQLYGATQILVTIQDGRRSRTMLYRVSDPNRVLQSRELRTNQHPEYLFPQPGTSIRFAVGHATGRKRPRCLVLENGTIRKAHEENLVPEEFPAAHPFRLLLATAFALDKDWVARVYLIDPSRIFGGRAALRHLASSILHIAPMLHSLFMVGRLTQKAKVAANSQVARELHDGIIQSLSLINMQIEDLKHHAGDALHQQAPRLDRIQQGIQQEITALRDLTHHLRTLELDSGNLLSFLAGMTVKFQSESGIAAQFLSDMKEVPLPSSACVELARIAQEGLINVRKHSKASEAYVRLNRRNGSLVLSILDNGQGFAFSGRRTHEELQNSGEGPIILMERADSIGAKVTIESYPNSGACIEVVVPCT
jgi:signal transduction histidine kinase